MTTETIRILVVDDHLVVRHGIAQLLSAAPDVTIVGEAENGEAALRLCETLIPDIVLMDIRMPGMGGLAATEALRRSHPDVRVIGLSTFAEGHTVASMRTSGAHAHLPKSVTFDELIGTIRAVHQGIPVAQDAVKPVATGANIPATITGQQRRVLMLLAKGFTNPEIAGYLGFSVSTANYHVGALLTKLGVSNRAEAAAMAIREQLVDEHDL